MNIVHLVVVKNSFYILESGRTIRKSAHFSLILGIKNLVKIGTQHMDGWLNEMRLKLTQPPIEVRVGAELSN